MPAWHDPEHWQKLLSGETCPICLQGRPLGIVAELESGWVSVDEATRVRGYCCLVSRRHVVDVHELSSDEAAALMADLRMLSRAVQRLTGAVKMNFEIHGNTIPHLHVHVIPRYRGDELETPGKSLGTLTDSPYVAGEFSRFAGDLREALIGSARPDSLNEG